MTAPAERPSVLVVFGTRPELIKLAPVIRRLSEDDGLRCDVLSTGQHREMVAPIARRFGVTPRFDLAIMRPNQTLNDIVSTAITGVDRVLAENRYDWVIVQGDTSTAAAAGLAAFHRRVRVGHVEAGLRTHDRFNPWPEEANRRLLAVVADRHWAPTERARQALLAERIDPSTVSVTGNTGIDALFWMRELIAADPVLAAEQEALLGPRRPGRRLVLVTGHRRESFGDGIRRICEALTRLAGRPDVDIVYPVHLNPNVREPVHAMLAGHDNIRLLPPVDYAAIVDLMGRASLILTDSGGIQEEAPSFNVPVLVMRETTERQEAVDQGVARLVGTDPDTIVGAAHQALDDPTSFAAALARGNPFGDGHAAERIRDDIRTIHGLPPLGRVATIRDEAAHA